MKGYIVINPDNTVTLHAAQEVTYDLLSETVGGYIEGVPIPGCSAYINEEGKIKGLPVNHVATVLAKKCGAIFPEDYIVGPMILVGEVNEEGDDTPLDLAVFAEKLRETYGLTLDFFMV